MVDWLQNHIYNALCGLFFALIGYFVEIKGAVHVMWAAIAFDLIAGVLASVIVKKERFSMKKFMVAVIRAFAVTLFVALLYAMDREMHQEIAASYNIAAWLISGFYVWGASENLDKLTGGRIFGVLNSYISKRIENTTGVDFNATSDKNHYHENIH